MASLSLLGVACKKDGGGKGAGSATSYLPKSASAVFGVNFEKIRTSALYEQFKDKLEKQSAKEMAEFKEVCGIDMMTSFKSFTVAMGADPQNEKEMFVAVNLDTPRAKFAECAKKMTEKGTKVEIADDGAFATYTVKGDPMPVWWASDSTVVMSPAKSLDALKALSTGEKLKDNAELVAMMGKTDTGAMIWAAGNVPKGPMAGAMGSTPTSGHFALNAPSGIDAKVGIEFADEAGAKTAHETMKQQLEGAKGQPMVGDLLKGVTLEASGKTVNATVKLSKEDVDKMISMAKMFGM